MMMLIIIKDAAKLIYRRKYIGEGNVHVFNCVCVENKHIKVSEVWTKQQNWEGQVLQRLDGEKTKSQLVQLLRDTQVRSL